jgi:VWFA-related protein
MAQISHTNHVNNKSSKEGEMKLHNHQDHRLLFWGSALVMGMFLLFGCGGGGGGGGGATPPATSPIIALDRDSLDFGNQVIGQTADRSLTVQNTGNGDLVIGAIAAAQPSPFSNYAAADTCSNQTLGPNGSCSVVVRFEPKAYGDFSGSLLISSNAGDRTVNLGGNGRELKVTITRVDTSACPEIKLRVSVTDANNTPVAGLVEKDFSVEEQGAPVGLTSVDKTGTIPVSVALALDDSGSISDTFKKVLADSSKGFLDLLNLPPDEAAVSKFDSEFDLIQEFTSIKADLLTAVDTPYGLSRTSGTKFYAAVDEALTIVSERLAVNPSHIGAVIMLSDGLDVDSTETLQEVIDDARRNGVLVYTMGFGDQLQSGIMKELADETGGIYQETPSQAELEEAYLSISGVWADQYEITFTTAQNKCGSDNNLTVFVDTGVLRGDDTVLVTYY